MWIPGLLALFVVAIASARTLNVTDLSESTFSSDIDNWFLTDEETETFRQAIELLKLPDDLHRSDWRSFSAVKNVGICLVCKSALKTFIKYRRHGMSDEKIARKATKLCTTLNLQPAEVCKGAIDLNLPTILYIIDNKPNLEASTICGVLLESKTCPIDSSEFEWTVSVDSGPAISISKRIDTGKAQLIQLSDLHYDPNYEPYGNSFCKAPTCCRRGQNDTNNSGKLAGYWGDFNYCDTPWHAAVDAFDHVRDTHPNVEYIYFTGDIIDHGVWETTKEGNLESIVKSYHQIQHTFKHVPFFPILGNHEPHPLNLFAPRSVTREDLSTQWLYDLVANIWIGHGWLPESTRSSILAGGYYTVPVRPGFRVVALNSNVCYCYNWWLWYSPKDPDNQLQWLANTLLEAERNHEFVHILSHIPVGSKHCTSTWRREYLKIISRFSHIIVAQFNGHTHNDEINVYYNENSEPNHLAWNGGSLTTYQNLNLNYKVYSINRNDFTVSDYDNWMYNLTEANLNPSARPRWFKSYSFKEEYGLSNLSPKSVSNWLSVAVHDEILRDKYYRNFFKHAEPALASKCNTKCKQEYICRIITSMDADKQCRNLKR